MPSVFSCDAVLQILDGRSLLLVSNREPYVHQFCPDGSIHVVTPAGGLVTSLDPVMRACKGTWIAWGSGTADFVVTDAHGRLRVPPTEPAYTLRRLKLSEDVVENSYYGYSNQALWPLCHSALEKPIFSRAHWNGYVRSNREFAGATVEEAERNRGRSSPVIWLHDYHLSLAPAMIRRALPDAVLAHFWHIPWPPWDIFRICPQRRELLEGLLANDVLGFHLPWYGENFMTCCEQELQAKVDRESRAVLYRDHVTAIAACPISIDVDAYRARAAAPEIDHLVEKFRRKLALDDQVVALGVDRLDYTKGIPQRLDAFALFLENHPEYRGKITLIQKVERSRSRISAYRQLEKDVQSKVHKINQRFSSGSWAPVIYMVDGLDDLIGFNGGGRDCITALYRLADVMMVTSLCDGMNLVAKEFIAAQTEDKEDKKVLILSEMAGASSELTGAVYVNPFDVDSLAEAIYTAVNLTPEEARARMRAMKAALEKNDVFAWMRDFLSRIPANPRYRSMVGSVHMGLPDLSSSMENLKERLRSARALALFLDFDGTLAPIAPTPSEARLPPETKRALGELLRHKKGVYGVISGRSLQDLKAVVGLPEMIYSGNHGLEIEAPAWKYINPEAARTRAMVDFICDRLEGKLSCIPGVIVERKGYTATVHYRLVEPHRVPEVARKVASVVKQATRHQNRELSVNILEGKKSFEIRPDVDWDKGAAVRLILKKELAHWHSDEVLVIYIGDDQTDESAFAVVRQHGIGIRVGATSGGRSQATFSLASPGAVCNFLQWLRSQLDEMGTAAPRARLAVTPAAK